MTPAKMEQHAWTWLEDMNACVLKAGMVPIVRLVSHRKDLISTISPQGKKEFHV